jgi:hypothetical protein
LTDSEEPSRPYHLWNASEKEQLRWRYYSDRKRAHIGALIEARWAEIGTVIEVFDARNGELLGQYRRRVHDIHFMNGGKL